MRKAYLPLALAILLMAAVLRISGLYTYPPGPHYDEGAELLITRSIAFGGANLFPIANSYQGRETLYHYLNAPLLRFIKDDIFTLQMTSVFSNMLTVAASMTLGRLMFRGRRGLIIGLAIGVMMTISFHQIYISRQAFRSVLLPLCQALSLLFLWRGLNAYRRDWLWLILGGFFSALALYTYMASRLFPLWLILGGTVLLFVDRAQFRKRLRQGAIFFAILGITALPMIDYALRQPEIFLGRLAEVTNTGTDVTLMESIRLHLRMFFIEGEQYVRYNDPGRSYFTLPEGLFLLIGLVVAGWRLTRPGRASERTAYFLALLSPLMVIPSVISLGGLPPNFLRSLGMMPLIFVLVAVGFEAVYDVFRQIRFNGSWQSRDEMPLLAAFTLVILVIGSTFVSRAYFDWAGRADLFYQSDGDLAAAAQWLPSHVDADTLVYVASYHREHPTIITGWRGEVTWLGTDSLFLPPLGKTGLYIFAHDVQITPEWSAWLDSGQLSDIPLGADATAAFRAFRVSGDDLAAQTESVESEQVHNNLMTLMGLHAASIPAGTQGVITMDWRIDQAPPYARLRPILELRDSIGTVLSTSDAYLLGTNYWRPGELMMQRVPVDVPIGTIPGEYGLYATWVDRDSGTYLAYQDESGAFAGITAQIGSVEVIRPDHFSAPDVLPITIRQPFDVAEGVRLLGWNPPQNTRRPGESLNLTLFWQAVPTQNERQSVAFEAVLVGDSETVIQPEVPVGGMYSASQWIGGELITAPVRWLIPREQPAGSYDIVLRVNGHEIALGTLEVASLARVFDAPSVDDVLEATLDESLQLYGYTTSAASDAFTLDLVWKSLQDVSEDYTVFVHVFDDTATRIAQYDRMPIANTYPTSLWMRGEYVMDRYTFSGLPSGDYVLHIGLYLQANGQRLNVTSAENQPNYIEIQVPNPFP